MLRYYCDFSTFTVKHSSRVWLLSVYAYDDTNISIDSLSKSITLMT